MVTKTSHLYVPPGVQGEGEQLAGNGSKQQLDLSKWHDTAITICNHMYSKKGAVTI